MKIDRQMGIISILLQKNKTTASYLAERFEVSRRTILRDIEDINRAGFPIVSESGRGGGVYLMEGYRLDRTALSKEDMQAILSGLQGLDSVSDTNRYRTLMDKLYADNNHKNQIIIDLSSWDRTAAANKTALIRQAMDESNKLSFEYHSPKGSGQRKIEPYHLIFQWSGWYVWGWCEKRKDYRMFKLNRITSLKVTDESFSRRQIPDYIIQDTWSSDEKATEQVTVKFDSSVKWRVIDEFGADAVEEDKHKNIWVKFTPSDLTSFYSHILSFGDKAEITAPEEYRDKFANMMKKILKKY